MFAAKHYGAHPQLHNLFGSNGVDEMRSRSLFACILLGTLSFAAITANTRSAADGPMPQKKLQFLLVPNETKDQVRAVPYYRDQTIPKYGTLVTCSSLRFSNGDLVFEDAVIETEDQKTTAREATFVVSDASIKYSGQVNVSVKNPKGRRDLLNALNR